MYNDIIVTNVDIDDLVYFFFNFPSSLTTGKIQKKNIQETVVTGNKTISRII